MKATRRHVDALQIVSGVFVLALLAVVVFDVVARASHVPRCKSKRATIIGTAGDDVLVGTDRRDIAVLKQGNDAFFGLAGNDLICGNRGDDFLEGGSGVDRAIGGRGTDTCVAENRNSCESQPLIALLWRWLFG